MSMGHMRMHVRPRRGLLCGRRSHRRVNALRWNALHRGLWVRSGRPAGWHREATVHGDLSLRWIYGRGERCLLYVRQRWTMSVNTL